MSTAVTFSCQNGAGSQVSNTLVLVSLFQLRDGGESFSNKKCEKRAGAGERQGGHRPLSQVVRVLLGNLRTTTKFTTTTSVDWERTGKRTSVSAGKRKLKMLSIGRSTTTTLNVNKHVEVVQL